jgi:hypothetical protein
VLPRWRLPGRRPPHDLQVRVHAGVAITQPGRPAVCHHAAQPVAADDIGAPPVVLDSQSSAV